MDETGQHKSQRYRVRTTPKEPEIVSLPEAGNSISTFCTVSRLSQVCIELKTKYDTLKPYTRQPLALEEVIALLSSHVLSSSKQLLQVRHRLIVRTLTTHAMPPRPS
jgi:hypothetical protein